MPTQSKTTTKDIEAALGGEKVDDSKSIAGFPIMPVSNMEIHINALIYGDPGTGKTVLAGSAAAVEEMSPVLFVDVEGGTMPLSVLYPSVEVVRVKSFRDLQKVYSKLYDTEGGGYKTVVLDSLTELQKLSMAGIMKLVKAEKPDQNIDQPRIQDWGVNLGQCRTLIRGFRDLPMNVIFTALNEEGEKNGKQTNRPLFQGKLKGEGPGFVDIIGYYYVDRKHNGDLTRKIMFRHTNTTMAKDRSTRLPDVIEDPTMEVIYRTALGLNV
jgi:hypothetical protein